MKRMSNRRMRLGWLLAGLGIVPAAVGALMMYVAWQQQSDPTRFVHLFIFEDAAAQQRHGESQEVRLFESVYGPELVGGPVVFTDYDWVAGKR